VVPIQDPDTGARLQKLLPLEGPAEGSVDEGSEGDREGKDRSKIRDLLADVRCSQAALDYLSTTDAGTAPAEDDAQSEASEWERRERREWEEE
jgi:hypothetical protein